MCTCTCVCTSVCCRQNLLFNYLQQKQWNIITLCFCVFLLDLVALHFSHTACIVMNVTDGGGGGSAAQMRMDGRTVGGELLMRESRAGIWEDSGFHFSSDLVYLQRSAKAHTEMNSGSLGGAHVCVCGGRVPFTDLILIPTAFCGYFCIVLQMFNTNNFPLLQFFCQM